jgi:diaminohydroxyphosphoribosylaminopyrimidine deaminase/5-amino-6-(5-phosphoribosylamino)uracil reductase
LAYKEQLFYVIILFMINKDEFYMQKALELARLGTGHTSPNPMVGCVIVKNNRIISDGWHKKAGKPHAEAEALAKAGKKAKGAVLYVNLEPCCHTNKRTPPCTTAIINCGIKKVVVAMVDPNPEVNSGGFAVLESAGVKTVRGVLEKQAKYLNRFFVKNVKKKMPYIIMKAAVSLDGKMALSDGTSQWITGPEARESGHQLRLECDAIAAGIGTILKDNPYLDCRIDKNKKIKKIIFDRHGRIQLGANIFKNSTPGDIYIFTSTMPETKMRKLVKLGVNVITRWKNLYSAAALLYGYGINSVLVEGGGVLHTSFLREKLYDEAWLYVAPIFIGSEGLPVAGRMGLKKLADAVNIKNHDIIRVGEDVLIKGEISYVQRHSL